MREEHFSFVLLLSDKAYNYQGKGDAKGYIEYWNSPKVVSTRIDETWNPHHKNITIWGKKTQEKE